MMQVADSTEPGPYPPLFVALTDAAGRRLLRLVTLDEALEGIDGKFYCEAVSPSGLHGSGWRTFGGAMPATVTYGMILELLPRVDMLSLWYWSSIPVDMPDEDELEQVVVWSGNVPVESTKWHVILRTDAGSLVAPDTDRTDLTLQIPVAGGPALFMPFRSIDLFHVAVEEHGGDRRMHWRVVSHPGLATAYWSFHRAGKLDAAAGIALRLLDDLEGGATAQSDATVAVVHAAVRLRTLGREFRNRVRAAFQARDDDIDLMAARWILRFEAPGGRYDEDAKSLLHELSQRLTREMPHHTELLRLLFERYPLAVDAAREAPSSDEVLRDGLDAVRRFAHAAEWDFDMLAYHAQAPREPADTIVWDDVEAFVRTEKKSPNSSPSLTI